MIFRQHLPAYFDEGIERWEITVPDTKALLALEKIHQWTENKDFHRFSKSQYWDTEEWNNFSDFHKDMYKEFKNGGWHLMAEFKNGTEWWVLGTSNEEPDLPLWVPIHTGPKPVEEK